jgi:succinoglycan biosynthesis transport protein ExoP
MEAKQYIMLLQRWAWLLIIGLILGGASAFVFSALQQPVFRATIQVQIMRAPASDTSDFSYLNDQQLAQTYTRTIVTRPILQAVGENLGVNVSRAQITAEIIPNTQLIQISVEDSDPQRATDITNTLVDVFIKHNDDLQAARFAGSEESLKAQISQVEDQISAFESAYKLQTSAASQNDINNARTQMDSLQQQIVALKGELAAINPTAQPNRALPTLSPEVLSQVNAKELSLNQLQGMYDLYQQLYNNLVVLGTNGNLNSGQSGSQQIQSTLSLYQQIRVNLLNSYENLRLSKLRSTSNIIPVEPAVVPDSPIRPKPLTNTLFGLIVGLLLSGGVAFLIEYLNDSIKNAEDVERILGLPVLGYIGEVSKGKNKDSLMSVTKQPRSPIAEAFRSLRTNLEFAGETQPLHSILVTSPGPGDGKTTIAANLASIFAQGGKHVTLVDADLRRPGVHRFFELDNHVGLMDVFNGRLTLDNVTHSWNGIGEVSVITTGNLPSNPTEILDSEKMVQLLASLKAKRDIVILDSAPSIVADAQVLAAKVDGVIVVVRPGSTKWGEVRATLEQLQRAKARVLGIVFSRIPQNRSNYYGGYKHYSPYTTNKYYSYEGNPVQPDEVPVKQK